MFLAGWHFGEKEMEDTRIHDIGLRYHLVTFLLCVSVGYAAYYVGWETETLQSMTIGVLCWGIGLFVHLVFFLLEYNKTIKGYAKSDIFD
jgi:heme/copper-type cytochrome/quinol oxidase subunit 4